MFLGLFIIPQVGTWLTVIGFMKNKQKVSVPIFWIRFFPILAHSKTKDTAADL